MPPSSPLCAPENRGKWKNEEKEFVENHSKYCSPISEKRATAFLGTFKWTSKINEALVTLNDRPNQSTTIIIIKVTAGNFLPTSKNCGEFLAYAVGAPRANGTGQVVLFVKCHSELLKVSSLYFLTS